MSGMLIFMCTSVTCYIPFFYTATFPLDLFKTRLQLQGEVALSQSPHGDSVVAKRKGLFAIARGIGEREHELLPMS